MRVFFDEQYNIDKQGSVLQKNLETVDFTTGLIFRLSIMSSSILLLGNFYSVDQPNCSKALIDWFVGTCMQPEFLPITP